MRVEVPAVRWRDLDGPGAEESSSAVRARVLGARERARRRGSRINANIPPSELEAACKLERAGRSLLRTAVRRLGLTARGYHRALRVARTIADLSEKPRVTEDAVAEALRYRGPA